MNIEFVKIFNEKRGELRQSFKDNPPDKYADIFKRVITMIYEAFDEHNDKPDPEKINVLDYGDYQGNLVFIVAANGYQPSTFWHCVVSYGSCSGCDTFEAIRGYSDEPLNETQLDDLCTLALHMVQKLREFSEPRVYGVES